MPESLSKPDFSAPVIYFSRFHCTSEAGGGCRRTAQIANDLRTLGFTFISSRDHSWDYKSLPDYASYQEWGGLPEEYAAKWHPGRRDDVAFQHYVSWSWTNELKGRHTLKLALVDDPLYFSPLVEYLAEAGVPVVALCHNIEALSRSQVLEEGQRELLASELCYIRLCSLAVTISREETFLLRNLGINALYHPYFPVSQISERMLRIRTKRRGAGNDFLLVGTANNAPTMKGMQEMMRRWSSINKSIAGARLIVAGYGTDPLRDFADGKNVIFKGAVSSEELDEILLGIGACIAYQEDGSGALTKICEFLLAGIPVLANSHAARSYYNLPGVVEFTETADLARASRLIATVPPDFPLIPPPDSDRFLTAVIAVINASTPSQDSSAEHGTLSRLTLCISEKLRQAAQGLGIFKR